MPEEGMQGAGEHETPAQQEREDTRYEQLERIIAEQEQRIGALEAAVSQLSTSIGGGTPTVELVEGGAGGPGAGGETPVTHEEEKSPAARHPYFRRFGD